MVGPLVGPDDGVVVGLLVGPSDGEVVGPPVGPPDGVCPSYVPPKFHLAPLL